MLTFAGEEPSSRPTIGDGIGGLFKTVSILRIGSGLVLALFHAWQGAIGAWQFLWQEKAWNWVTILNEAQAPYPHLVAPAAAALLAAVAVSWIVGFLTRLFSFLFIPLGIGALALAERIEAPQVETCWLYLLIAVTLMLFGSGNVSLDWFFQLARRPKKEKPQRW